MQHRPAGASDAPPAVASMYDSIPADLAQWPHELLQELLRSPTLRIERIVSQGHQAPASGWYDQDEHEWVLLLRGCAKLEFADGSTHTLAAGDYLHLPAHTRHRVAWTDPTQPSIWLAVFYSAASE